MRMLRDKYSVIRNELGRIPMLTDIYRHDPSLVMTMAQKANSYYDFARDTEAMLSRKGHDEGFADALVPIDTQGEQWLKNGQPKCCWLQSVRKSLSSLTN